MKRILALLLVLSMLLVMVACGNSGGNTPSSDPATAPQSQPTKPSESSKPTQGSQPSGEHTHSYNSEVTTAAACMSNGVKTYTCSCGDTYTEEIPAPGHFFSEWEIETKAFIDKDGTEKKTCSVCSTSKTKKSVANATNNSFYDAGLPHILGQGYGLLSGSSLLEYASYTFTEYADKPVAAATLFSALSERFNITDDLKASMKEWGEGRFGYDASNDTFTLHDYGISGMGSAKLVGYTHNGGNAYSAYYAYNPFDDVVVYHEVKLEYNRSNGGQNKYLSFDMIDELPSDIILPGEGE